MTDYTKTTGTTGKMMIRDTGSYVEFWFKAGYTNDYWNGLDFNWTANGTTTAKSINYPTGAQWYKVGSRLVSSSTRVTFKLLTQTNTQGMGGPTTFYVDINRAGIPDPPSAVKLTNIEPTRMIASYTDGDSNGSWIDKREVGYGVYSTGAQIHIPSDKYDWILNLTPGTKYYFWARTHNAEGWSAWGPRSEATTIAASRVKVGTVWKYAIPYVNVNGVWKYAWPWVRQAGVWKQTN